MWRLFEKNKKKDECEGKLTYSYSVDIPDNKYTLLKSTSLNFGTVDVNTYIPRIGEHLCLDNDADPTIFKLYAEVTDVFYNIPLNFICIHTKAYAMDAFIDDTRKYIEFNKQYEED